MKALYTLTFALIAMLLSSSVFAQISEDELAKATQNYLKSDPIFSKTKIKNKKNPAKEIYNEKNEAIAYVVELEPVGYIVFSSSKELYPVVAYSDKSNFDYTSNEYNGMLALIQSDLGCQHATLQEANFSEKQKEIIVKNNKAWEKLLNTKPKQSKYIEYHGPNLPDVWGGVNSVDDLGNTIYVGNYYTPNHYSPGCVATSLSQILHMFEWPPIGRREHTNNDTQGSSQGTYYSAFGRKWYDWDNMLDLYNHKASTITERKAMGALAYQCGTAVDMEYENSGSTSLVSKTPSVLSSYFRCIGHYELGTWVSFWPRLRQNLEDGYAVQLAIRDVSSGHGHAMVCDGWRQEDAAADKYYHMNNGWWGTCNGWYRLQVSFSDCGYDAIDGGVFDILPEPMFEDEVVWSDTDTKTFTISWNVSKHLNWEAFELQEDKDNSGTWTTLSNTITDTFYVRTVPSEGVYKYRVRAKSSGGYFLDSYSEILRVPVEKIVYLNFDGDDSFYLKDNTTPEYANTTDRLDISDNWTIETWFEADTYTSGNYNVILDRKTVFSMYLIDDADGGGDFAIKFVARDAANNITASIKSDVNSNIYFGEWIHVAVTRDGTTTKMFINGTKVDESTDANFSLTASTNALNIGARYWGSYSRYLDGRLDELRISTVARYDTDFCPDRFYRFKRDNDTRVLLHMDAFSGNEIKEYSYNFINPTLRASSNDPGWSSSTCPIIIQEPEDMSQCEGAVTFTITAVQAASYQWQENAGSGFVNITDGGVYSGATTNTLNISDIQTPTNLDGYKYRCIVTGSATNKTRDCSKEVLLTVYPTCTTWTGTLWTNGEPNLTMTATIAGNYTLPYDISAKKMTILSPYDVIVPPNITLTVQDYFENHGSITLQSGTDNIPTGALTLYGTQNNFGTMTAQRYVTVPTPGIWGNWHLVCLPFEETPLIGDIFSGTYYIYKNLEPVYNWQPLTATDNMFANEGILVQLDNAGQLIEYTGNFGNGSYSETLPLTSGTNLGWKLMKNPYPSPIDWDAASGWTRTNINGTVYTFDPENNGGSNQYSAWDGSVATYSGSRYINSFQAYFVQALTDGAVIATDNNIRVKNSDVSGNYLKSTIKDLVRLEVTDPNNKKDEIVVYAAKNDKLSINTPPMDLQAPDLSIAEGEKNYVIKRFSENTNKLIVPLSLKTNQIGNFNLRVSEFKSSEYKVALCNRVTGETEIICNKSRHNFTISEQLSGSFNEFELLFTKAVSGISESTSQISIYAYQKNVFILKNNKKPASVHVYDLSGKLILKKKIDKIKESFQIKENGIYIVKFMQNDKTYSQKIIIKN